MSCRLCLLPKPLQDSHVIPELLYKPFYHQEHRFFETNSDDGTQVSHHQKGLSEPLLCWDCEQHFSKNLETPFGNFFHKTVYPSIGNKNSPLCFSGLSYKVLKLFWLSVFWRSSVSQKEFFRHVNFGDFHSERIRKLLLGLEAGPVDSYGFTTTLPTCDGEEIGPCHILPRKQKSDGGHTLYAFVISGFALTFHIRGEYASASEKSFFVQEAGEWTIQKTELDQLRLFEPAYLKAMPALKKIESYRKPARR